MAAFQTLALPGDYLGREHDDAHYALAALALTRGEYRLGINPGNPRLTIITPGWPLLLAPAAAVSGQSPWGYHLTAWASLVAAEALLWLWLRRRLAGREAAAITAAFGLNPLVLARAGSAMTEMPATALTLGLLLASESAGWPAWATGLWLAFLWLVRQPSVALVAAFGVVPLARRRWKEAAWTALPTLATIWLWGRWSAWEHADLGDVSDLASAYSGRVSAAGGVALGNLRFYLGLAGSLALPWPPRAGAAATAAAAGLAGLCLRGASLQFKRAGYSPALGWLAFGAVMQLFWPWRYERYLVPFLPFLAWTSWLAVEEAFTAARRERWAAPAAAAMVAAACIGQARVWRAGPERSKPELAETYSWIREHTPVSAAFSSLFYSRDAWYCGRPFAPYPEPAEGGEFAGRLRRRRISYALIEESRDTGSSLGSGFAASRDAESIRRVLRESPFRLEYENGREGTRVYSLPRGPDIR